MLPWAQAWTRISPKVLTAWLFVALAWPAGGAESGVLQETRQLLQQGGPLRVVCFGDSITGVYYHTGGVESWSDLLARFLKSAHPNAEVSVYNAGVSGNTTTTALARLDRDVLSRAPQLVAIMFGMNDAVSVAPEEFTRNLATMVARARAAGAAVILLTPTQVQTGDPQRTPERLGAYAALVRKVARETRVPLVDCHGTFAEVASAGGYRWARLMSDAIHPNLHGHRLIAAEVARVILGGEVESELAPGATEPPRSSPSRPKVAERGGVNVLAAEPYDAMLRDAVRTTAPGRDVRIVTWPAVEKSLADLIEDTRRRGRWRTRHDLDGGRPDLIVLALPAPEKEVLDEALFRGYSALVNGSLSFGAPEWDLWILLPPADEQPRSGEVSSAREIARDVVASKGLTNAIVADDGEAAVRRGLTERLAQWSR